MMSMYIARHFSTPVAPASAGGAGRTLITSSGFMISRGMTPGMLMIATSTDGQYWSAGLLSHVGWIETLLTVVAHWRKALFGGGGPKRSSSASIRSGGT